jgi:hypothetical protein
VVALQFALLILGPSQRPPSRLLLDLKDLSLPLREHDAYNRQTIPHSCLHHVCVMSGRELWRYMVACDDNEREHG